MNCPNCAEPLPEPHPSSFCPDCGAFIGIPPADGNEPYDAVPVRLRQMRAGGKSARAPKRWNVSPGALLTGSIALDAALGFLGEVVAVALFVYAAYLFYPTHADLFAAFGCFAAGSLLLYSTHALQKRYPRVAAGYQAGRDTWGRGFEHLTTLLFGVAVLVVFFPLGGLLICLGGAFGLPAWIAAFVIAYLLGMLLRRMNDAHKRRPPS